MSKIDELSIHKFLSILYSLMRIGVQHSSKDQAPRKSWRKPYLFSIEIQTRKEIMETVRELDHALAKSFSPSFELQFFRLSLAKVEGISMLIFQTIIRRDDRSFPQTHLNASNITWYNFKFSLLYFTLLVNQIIQPRLRAFWAKFLSCLRSQAMQTWLLDCECLSLCMKVNSHWTFLDLIYKIGDQMG